MRRKPRKSADPLIKLPQRWFTAVWCEAALFFFLLLVELIHHQYWLMCGIQCVTPEVSLGINFVPAGYDRIDGYVDKFVVDQTDDQFGFSRHCSVNSRVP